MMTRSMNTISINTHGKRMDWARHHRIRQAADIVDAGGVIAYPTEAVWGLGCDPFNSMAVHRLLQLKDRSVEKGLIIVAADTQQLEPLLRHLERSQLSKLADQWPGPFTYLIPNQNYMPRWVTGEHHSIAVRVSAHPLVTGLCRAVGGPIISTSANPAGMPPATSPLMVRRYFRDSLDAILPGATERRAKPSEIRDLISGEVIRAGG